MIYVRNEFENINTGINFYPLSDKASFGFKVKLFRKIFMLRYSKSGKFWFVGFVR